MGKIPAFFNKKSIEEEQTICVKSLKEIWQIAGNFWCCNFYNCDKAMCYCLHSLFFYWCNKTLGQSLIDMKGHSSKCYTILGKTRKL